MKKSIAAVFVFLLAGAMILVTASAWALTVEEEAKLLAADGADSDLFGLSVAVHGDTALVGAGLDSDNGPWAGSAYVFVGTDGAWSEVAKLLPASGSLPEFAYFGRSVALDGSTAIVGAPGKLDDCMCPGAALIFNGLAGVWTEQAILVASDGAAEDRFGWSVALDGDTAVIGADHDNDNGSRSGSAYVFSHSGGVWTEQAKLLPSDGAAEDFFGLSVALDGDTAVISAVADDDNGSWSGSAYVFTRTSGVWSQQAKLLASDGHDGTVFGRSVALDGDTVVIGADSDDDNGPNSGSAYVFTRTGGVWTEQAKLLPFEGATGDHFGWSVALDGDTVVVGADRDGDSGWNSGSAYVFTRAGDVWIEQAKLLASDGEAVDRFGCSAALDGDTAVIGAFLDQHDGERSGSAYVFRLRLDTLIVDIDIKPGSFPNSVNPNARGVIPVVTLGGDSLDVLDIDVTTLRFGPNEVGVAHNLSDSFTYNDHLQDVNLDGYVDLVTHYRTGQTGIACGDESATLTGETITGQPFAGSDSIRTVGCRSHRGRGQQRWRRLAEPE